MKDPDCDEPRIQELRRLHEDLDRAVLKAYGWDDLEVPPYCPQTAADHQALEAFQDEIIDRLHVLNTQRAADERLKGATAKGKQKGKPRPAAGGKRGAKASQVADQADLFANDGDDG
jgi:hypothetical protein